MQELSFSIQLSPRVPGPAQGPNQLPAAGSALSQCGLCCHIGHWVWFFWGVGCTGAASGLLAAATRMSVSCKPVGWVDQLLVGLSHPALPLNGPKSDSRKQLAMMSPISGCHTSCIAPQALFSPWLSMVLVGLWECPVLGLAAPGVDPSQWLAGFPMCMDLLSTFPSSGCPIPHACSGAKNPSVGMNEKPFLVMELCAYNRSHLSILLCPIVPHLPSSELGEVYIDDHHPHQPSEIGSETVFKSNSPNGLLGGVRARTQVCPRS